MSIRTPETDLKLWISCHIKAGTFRDATAEEKQRAIAAARWDEQSKAEWDQPWTLHIPQCWLSPYSGDPRLTDPFLLKVWFYFTFDGKAFIINYTDKQLDKEVKSKPLTPGSEVWLDCPMKVEDDKKRYVMRLHVAWPKLERPNALSLSETLAKIEAEPAWRSFNQQADEVWVSIAHGYHEDKHYQSYPAAQFPQAFLTDVANDGKTFSDVAFIEITHWYYTVETCRHSDDYIDAARAHGEDATGEWQQRERHMDDRKWLYEVLPQKA